MYIGSISVFTRVLLLGRMVDWLGEAKLSRIGLLLLGAGVVGMPLARNLWMLAIAVALIPLGTAFTFPCVTSMLSRVTSPRERGLYMGMQQTYGGVARIIAPLFFGWSFDTLGVSSPYFFASAFIVATLLLSPSFAEVAHQPAAPAPPPSEPSPVTSRSPQVSRLSSPSYADQERE
jgi:MFS family permease